MTPDLAAIPLVIEGRAIQEALTGVGSYSRAVLLAARDWQPGPALLLDRASLPGARHNLWTRGRRHFSAIAGGSVTAVRLAGETGQTLAAPDLFRLAQVRFGYRGSLLPVDLPGPPGVMHWPHPVPIFARGWANIYTVHDLIPIDQPELSPVNGARMGRMLHAIAPEAALFVTISDHTTNRLARFLPAGTPIMNCGMGLDLSEHPAASAQASPPFVVVGTLERRKNLVRLIEAYAAAQTSRPLLLIGPAGDDFEDIRRLAQATPGVELVPYLDRTALLTAIAGARALLFPSLAEGFGLPAAEAMTLGTPVMASGTGALGETVGGAALRVDPLDVAAMAQAITRLDRDDALCAGLAAKGLTRAEEFSLPAFALRLSSAYQQASAFLGAATK